MKLKQRESWGKEMGFVKNRRKWEMGIVKLKREAGF